MKALFLNVQTSGLDPAHDEILEFAMLPWDDGKLGNLDTDKFRALSVVPDPICKLNGYDEEARKDCATLRSGFIARIMTEIENNDGVIVAVNPRFVWDFIRTAAERMRVSLPSMQVRLIDVASMAVPLFVAGKVVGLSTAALATLVGRAPVSPLSAPDQVTLTKDIFEKIFTLYYGALK
jgi:DNA polymerase III alpha subunit (gram-positive type)